MAIQGFWRNFTGQRYGPARVGPNSFSGEGRFKLNSYLLSCMVVLSSAELGWPLVQE